mmetsp:Transcript_22107/g.36792  ORF Transcript_22107/g.36792 Transcript_22107/m.36792 type:complete len:671 (+) Transcript_22107:104-2116(+)
MIVVYSQLKGQPECMRVVPVCTQQSSITWSFFPMPYVLYPPPAQNFVEHTFDGYSPEKLPLFQLPSALLPPPLPSLAFFRFTFLHPSPPPLLGGRAPAQPSLLPPFARMRWSPRPSLLSSASVDLDGGVDLAQEPERAVVADGAGHEEEGGGDQGHVAEVDQRARGRVHVQLGGKVPHPVEQQVGRAGARGAEAAPPPAVVLRAELRVAEHDRDFRAGERQDQQHRHQEPEHVVDLVQPQGGHDEEELDAHGPKGEDAPEGDADRRFVVPLALGDEAREVVRAHGRLVGRLLEPVEGAREHQRRAHAQPEREHAHERAEGDGGRGALPLLDHVQEKEDGEDGPRVQQRRGQRAPLPLLLPEELEQARGVVPGEGAPQHVEREHGREQAPPVGRAQEAGQRQQQHGRGQGQQLHALAHEGGEGGGPPLGRPEHVPVHQLPAGLLARLLRRGRALVVARDIPAQRADHDHAHHAAQEEHDHQRVQDAEVVDLLVRVALQVHVPALAPLHLGPHPLHVVREDHLPRRVRGHEGLQVVHGGGHLVAGVQRGQLGVEGGVLVAVLHGEGDHLEPHHPRALEAVRVLMVGDHDAGVVVQVVPPVALLAHHCEAHGEPARVVVKLLVVHRHRQVVHQPVHPVVLFDYGLECVHLLLVELPSAQDLAGVRYLHLKLVG